jgi:hypothetical protein
MLQGIKRMWNINRSYSKVRALWSEFVAAFSKSAYAHFVSFLPKRRFAFILAFWRLYLFSFQLSYLSTHGSFLLAIDVFLPTRSPSYARYGAALDAFCVAFAAMNEEYLGGDTGVDPSSTPNGGGNSSSELTLDSVFGDCSEVQSAWKQSSSLNNLGADFSVPSMHASCLSLSRFLAYRISLSLSTMHSHRPSPSCSHAPKVSTRSAESRRRVPRQTRIPPRRHRHCSHRLPHRPPQRRRQTPLPRRH